MEFVSLSEHADEFLRVLSSSSALGGNSSQQSPSGAIRTVPSRCSSCWLGSGMPPAWHLISDPDYGDCVCLSVVSEGFIPDQDKLTAVIGKQVFLERFPLLHREIGPLLPGGGATLRTLTSLGGGV